VGEALNLPFVMLPWSVLHHRHPPVISWVTCDGRRLLPVKVRQRGTKKIGAQSKLRRAAVR